jgi:molybdopterin converting factor small subunit
MVVRPYDPDRARDTPLEGFSQVSVQLQRPADYVEPPLPIHAHWLHDKNRIFTTKETDESIINELHFALSNVGLHPFTLDCSKHSRGVPYFELVMVGKTPTDEGSFSSAVADISDLALAELTDTTPRERLNQLWRVNKRIQGPNVKWEIRPDLDFDWKKEGNKVSQSKKILLGTELDATLTFKLHELRSRLEDGVALVYLKYYNMPDHDDGQLVLFLEKRRIETGSSLTPQIVRNENTLGLPISWRIKKNNEIKKNGKTVYETHLKIGEEVRENVTAFNKEFSILTEKYPLKLDILGDTHINGQLTVSAYDVQDKKNTFQTKDQAAILKLSGIKKGSDMVRAASLRAEGEENNKGSKLIFATRSNEKGKELQDNLVIDSKGYIGIGKNTPEYPLDIGIDLKHSIQFPRFIALYNNADKLLSETTGKAPKEDLKQGLNELSEHWKTNTISIQATGAVKASGYFATSDQRVKTAIQTLPTSNALEKINGLRGTQYRFLEDSVGSVKTGFIAQEVEAILPEAVDHSSGFIPNIFAPSKNIILKEKQLKIFLEKDHHLSDGDEVRIITPRQTIETTVQVDSQTAFSISWLEENQEIDQVFVYGKKVDDFRSIDFQQLFALGIGGIQELTKRQENLRSEKEDLAKEVANQSDQIQSLETDLRQLKKGLATLQLELSKLHESQPIA